MVCEISSEVSGVPCLDELLLDFLRFDDPLLPSECLNMLTGETDPDLLLFFLCLLRPGEPRDELQEMLVSGGVHPLLE